MFRLVFAVLRFDIDTSLNREIPRFRNEIQTLIGRPGAGIDLVMHLNDDDLRLVIGPLEQNLLLLQLLYPVALIVVTILAAGLAVLILLQSAKGAAIMRSLGAKKHQVRLASCAEFLFVSILGATLAIIFMLLLGITIELAPIALYLLGALTGSVTGSILTTNRPVLELLQVKE